ncbi:MAG: DUF3365 domain-containing protein [Proteobacteria bacterium]|nr:DUF3365 domain-containing protein [Pseudomonadota bacterium]MBU1585181.1 DUF3365 domain-containing protein [Pseudomonadota bacterium]MBU2454494.1 DUF3365 domain-containing protein [Pseudomonadota bacterium]MBU2629071.1 DUF3365 domain-containing protein [Pseudomonadota bacterium]
MKQLLKTIKTKTLFFLFNGFFIIVLLIIIGFATSYNIKQHALDEAKIKAGMIADQYFAIHTYFSQKLKPAISKMIQPYRSKEYFDPLWMSSSYVVRQINKTILSIGENTYSIKDAAINARATDNEADHYERQFILQLNTDPGLMVKSSVQQIDNMPYYVFLRRGELIEESCLHCHGSPAQAPKQLVDIYGDHAGFKRNIGDYPHAIVIKIPLPKAYLTANRFALKLSLICCAIILVFFYVQYLLANYLLFEPISKVHSTMQKFFNKPDKLKQIKPLPSGIELNQLAKVFNSISKKLYQNKKENEVKYGNLFNSLKNSVLVFDAQTRLFVSSNQAASNLYGYTKDEFLQLHHNDITAEHAISEDSITKVIEGEKIEIPVRHHKKKDGTIFPVEITPGQFKTDNRIMLFGIIKDITESLENKKNRQKDEDRLRFMAHRLIEIREEECKRISLELHDAMGQSLTALGFNLNLFQNDISDSCQDLLTDSISIIDNLADQVQDLSLDLRPSMLDDLGLVPTLRWYLNRYTKRTRIKTKLAAVGLEEYKNENLEITIFRIVQESLNNVLKHAKAKNIELFLKLENTRFTGCIQDDGKGFDINEIYQTIKGKRIGLLSMKERISLLDGTFEIQSAKGQGTRISFEIPLDRFGDHFIRG